MKSRKARVVGTATAERAAAASARGILRAWKPPKAPARSPLNMGAKKRARLVSAITSVLTMNRLWTGLMLSGLNVRSAGISRRTYS
ncbi:hypothetical protein LILAB_12055 [Corallococcus macrosporus]|uniref:Uncharacterized protein n=1 Tax=Myxococcus fulvus (strain ATCC BAA-855 / HW-1) TaxID=483219 RepID=F8C6D0_MYXFH|nr:hypothetical protein LILAB_12055 [Corallococcus macrosporus]